MIHEIRPRARHAVPGAGEHQPLWAVTYCPEYIAYEALFLAWEESSFMTGSELLIDGGITAQ